MGNEILTSGPTVQEPEGRGELFWETVDRRQRLMGVAVRAMLPIAFAPVVLLFAPAKALILAVLGVYLALALVSLWMEAHGHLSNLRINLFIVFDVVLVLTASYVSGLQNSPLLSLLGTLLVAYTLQRGIRTGLVVLVLVTVLFGLGLALESSGVIPVAPLMPRPVPAFGMTGGPIGVWMVTAIALVCTTWLIVFSLGRVDRNYRALNRAIEAEQVAIEQAARVGARAYEVQRLESLGCMAGGVAHEFNNLLTVILGYSRLASEDVEQDPDAKADLEQVAQAANRGKRLVAQLLSYSQQRPGEFEVVDLCDFVSSNITMLQHLLNPEIRLRTELSDRSVKVSADRLWLEQAVVNLVTNAVDSMPEGGELTLTVRPTSGAMAELVVADTGRGMDEEVLVSALEAFFTTKPAGRGTGLGLSVVQEVVEKHGGQIGIDSEPGQGTRVSLRLPLVEGDDEVLSMQAEAPADVQGGAETILLVEDEALVRDVTQRALQRLGYRIEVAGDAEQAEKLFRAAPQTFDLLLTDVMLPGRTGRELAELICSTRPDLPVLFMTGYSDEVLDKFGFSVGPIDLLRKPFSLQDLGEKVRRLLDGEPDSE